MKKTNVLLLSSLICLNISSAFATTTSPAPAPTPTATTTSTTTVIIQDFDSVVAAIEAKLTPIEQKLQTALESLYAEAEPFIATLGQNLLTNFENQISNSVELNNLKTLLLAVEANPNLATVTALITGAIQDLEAEAADLKSTFLQIHAAQQTLSTAAKQTAAATTTAQTATAATTRAVNSAQVQAIQQIVNTQNAAPATTAPAASTTAAAPAATVATSH